MTTVAISGNTYPVKDQIKALGGRWDGVLKVWRVPADKADAARQLVNGGKYSCKPGERYFPQRAYRRNRTGCSCGSIVDVPRESDCAQCQHDA
jgi:hypothetical protein